MKVKFFPDDIESDVIEVPDDINEDELYGMACTWVADNVAGFWEIVEKGMNSIDNTKRRRHK